MNNTGTMTETVNQRTLTISEEPKLSRLQKLILIELAKKEDGSAWITTISHNVADSYMGGKSEGTLQQERDWSEVDERAKRDGIYFPKVRKEPNRRQMGEYMVLKPRYRASFSRSVRHLKQRGLVKTKRFSWFDDTFKKWHFGKDLVLTERGKNVAQKLKETC